MIYVASPYSHPDPAVREQRFDEACAFTARLLRLGFNAFSPIAHSHPLVRFNIPNTWEFFKKIDAEYISLCHSLVVLKLEGWENSVGVGEEILIARKLGRRITYVSPTSADDLLNALLK